MDLCITLSLSALLSFLPVAKADIEITAAHVCLYSNPLRPQDCLSQLERRPLNLFLEKIPPPPLPPAARKDQGLDVTSLAPLPDPSGNNRLRSLF